MKIFATFTWKYILIFLVTTTYAVPLPQCESMGQLRCDKDAVELFCGSDEKTYLNSCFFALAACQNTSLRIAHPGPCPGDETSSLPPVGGERVVLSIVCGDVESVDCSKGPRARSYCGTDGRTYISMCQFEKARCRNKRLHIKSRGPCKDHV